MKSVKRNEMYSDAQEYFELDGSGIMKLTPDAAVSVCNESTKIGATVSIVEGGLWHSPGFEARLDCIWHGLYKEMDKQKVMENNLKAVEFINDNKDSHNAFVVTTSSN